MPEWIAVRVVDGSNAVENDPAVFAPTLGFEPDVVATRIDLSWADVDGENGYILERSTNGTTWSQIATPGADSTSYSDTGLVAGTKYYYRLRATSSVGNSATTTTVNATSNVV